MSLSNFLKLAVGRRVSSKNKDICGHVKTMIEFNGIGSWAEKLRHVN